jgi:lipopolysaccharide/colanic/teichoic acid biosynthesis glycosyltransferase
MSDLSVTLDGLAVEQTRSESSVHAIFCRISDIMIASIVLIFIAPLLLTAMVLVWAQDGGPMIFAHSRIGRYGQTFKCLKLRSMRMDASEQLARILASDPEARIEWERDQKLRNDPRITKIGRFLRRSSIDEFPQLVNVLKGEMSLVGPRPIVQAEVARYGRRFKHYASVKPGITGLWQVSGRNDTSYSRRVAMDVMYSRAYSAPLYYKILFMTVPAVLFSRGSF